MYLEPIINLMKGPVIKIQLNQNGFHNEAFLVRSYHVVEAGGTSAFRLEWPFTIPR